MRLVPEQHHEQHVKAIGARPLPGEFHVDEAEYERIRQEWRRSLPHADEATLHTKVMGHMAWQLHHERLRADQERARPSHSHHLELRWIIALLAALVLLLAVPRAHCQFSKVAYVATLSAGSAVGFHAAPFAINCGSGMSCTDDGYTYTLTSTGAGSTAWSALTAGTNSNAGTFAATGNTWDFTGATLFKQRVAAGLTASINGDLGQDSTTGYWHFWQNAHDRLIAASTNVGVSGQVLISNADGTGTYSDPIVSYAYVNLLNVASATGTQTSTKVRVPTLGGFGTLYVTYASITGSPSGCTLQMQNVDSLGNVINNGSTISTSPANGTTTAAVPVTAALQTTAQEDVVYACSAYPSAGTISVDFAPGIGAAILNASLPVTQSGTWTVTTTPPSNASTNVAQFGGNAVATGTGASGSGIPRVTVSNDSQVKVWDGTNTQAVKAGSTAAAAADPSAVVALSPNSPLPTGSNVVGPLSANQSVNVNQVAGSGVATAATGVEKVGISGATGSALDATTAGILDTNLKNYNGSAVGAGNALHVQPGTGANFKTNFDNTTPGTTDAVSMLQPARTTGTITSATSTVSLTVTGYSVATVTVNGTYAGVTVNFEFSDDSGTTWYTDTCTRTDTNVQETSEALPSNQTRAWDCGVYAATNFRVRSSAWTSGTANIGITLSAAPVEPAPTVALNSGSSLAANQSVNVSQFGGTNVVTGTGASGAGIPRVTVSNDSTVTANAGTGTFAMQQVGNGTVVNGQQAVTATATALATNTVKRACVKAFKANTIAVYVGTSGVTTSTGLELNANDAVCMPVTIPICCSSSLRLRERAFHGSPPTNEP